MNRYVLDFEEIDRTTVALVGGKAANLAELTRIEGIRVPAGCCVTTRAFQRIMADAPSVDALLDQLSQVGAQDREAIRSLSAETRAALEAIAVPDDIAAAIRNAHTHLGENAAYAIRSSATAEDSPTTSFAGQQDTYLNVVGSNAILQHISRCWASLYTERAVTYRLHNGLDHRRVRMAVVVQQMLFPDVSGILFTADPVTGNRKVASIDASLGLGEALVSGLVNADVYKVRDDVVISRAERQQKPVLTDVQIVELAQTGRRIEAHFGRPQDIEWCLVDDDFHIVQSRPITTLFPIPEAADGKNRVYVSVGHGQMMTDAMKPLGISMWQLTAAAPMHDAGGRLFVDVTQALASPARRAGLLEVFGRGDPLIRDALQTILDRGVIHTIPDEAPADAPASGASAPIETDSAIVDELIARTQSSIAALERDIGELSGTALLDFINADVAELKRILFDPQSHQVIMAGIEATWRLNERLHAWLGEKNAADTLAQSVANNVTSEMGFALLDVADAIRPHRHVVEFLERVEDDEFLEELPKLAGGRQARDAIVAWLDKYGMRCPGEIDITRPRWRERPGTLLPLILGNVRNFEAGEAERRFERGLREARQKERELLEHLRALPDGVRKADEAKRLIERIRTFIGYREYPKYGMVSRYFVYKQALLREAERLVHARLLRTRDDIFYLTFQELHGVVRTKGVDEQLLVQRKEAFRWHQALTPPRVLTSEGEALDGAYRRDGLPPGALIGLAVSAGTVEGRARVILNMADADVEPGDILVTAFTDPSWTPLFVAIRGLVTEVGGLMTHGAVIAREYGLPAVVGVQNVTRRIGDGQRIRVHGTEGYVEILS